MRDCLMRLRTQGSGKTSFEENDGLVVGRARDDLPRADAIVAVVSHKPFIALPVEDFQKKLVKGGCFIDVKAPRR